MDLQVSGGEIQLLRDLGSPSSIQNIHFFGSAAQGPLRSTSLIGVVVPQYGGGSAQLFLPVISVINKLRLGTTTPSKYYLGNIEIGSIYIGTVTAYSS